MQCEKLLNCKFLRNLPFLEDETLCIMCCVAWLKQAQATMPQKLVHHTKACAQVKYRKCAFSHQFFIDVSIVLQTNAVWKQHETDREEKKLHIQTQFRVILFLRLFTRNIIVQSTFFLVWSYCPAAFHADTCSNHATVYLIRYSHLSWRVWWGKKCSA